MTLFLSALILMILFLIGWIASIRLQNVSIVDAMWALSLGIPVFIYISSHEGDLTRKLILLLMALIWSLRLGLHLAKRIYTHHPMEDKRYAILRKKWAEKAKYHFSLVFFINAALVFLLSLPFYFSSRVVGDIIIIEWVGLIIFFIGLIGESLSDHQLQAFKEQNGSGKICDRGLWNYSRHPNYFFEAVIWLGIYLFCATSLGGISSLHAPLLMILLLTKVTGIPPTERSLLASKGDAYREYQKTTNAFIPWFKHKSSKTS